MSGRVHLFTHWAEPACIATFGCFRSGRQDLH